jgi:chromosome segregation ATPase
MKEKQMTDRKVDLQHRIARLSEEIWKVEREFEFCRETYSSYLDRLYALEEERRRLVGKLDELDAEEEAFEA